MTYGLTPAGFVKKPLNVILEEINQQSRDIFGESVNIQPSSPIGQQNGINASSLSDLWELCEFIYYAFDPSSAQRDALARLVQLNGISRKPATKSKVICTFSGNAGTIIPIGFEVGVVNTDNIFTTTVSSTIGAGGTIAIGMESVANGSIVAEANTLTVIINPLNGLVSATNGLKADVGNNEENDIELRNRRELSTEQASQNLIDSLYGTLNQILNVKSVNIFENDTNITDNKGIPPHSFNTIISGGNDEEIAKTLFVGKTPGVLTFGNTNVIINDEQNLPRVINFTRPILIPIFVIINTTNTGSFPANGVNLIQEAIIQYAQLTFIVGKNVERTRLYTPINSISGHSVQSLFIGKLPNPTGIVDIPINFNELSEFLAINIVVNVS